MDQARDQHSQRERAIRADERRIRRMAREEFSASLMNNTKWRELADALHLLRRYVCRVKFIDDDEVLETPWINTHGESYVEGTFGPLLWIAVEWLEIVPGPTEVGD